MSTLVITLPQGLPTAGTDYGYTLTADGHQALQHASTSATLLPDPGRAGEVVAVVPARALSWQRATLPPGAASQPARLRAVLEGLLEEQLLDDPAELHFALAPGFQGGSTVWVAVCDRAWLRAHLQALEAAGRAADRVVPEFAPGPTASGQEECEVLGSPEDAQLVLTGHGPQQAVAVLPLAAARGLIAGATEDSPPVRAEPAVAALAERLLGRRVQLRTASERALAAARGPWDLAQFDLASSGHRRLLRRLGSAANALARAPQWRAARWALGLAVALQIVGLNLWAWQDRQALAAKQAGVRSALTQTFPQVRVVVDAPVQMERELAQLRQAAGSMAPGDLEPLMAAAGAALPASQVPAQIEYQDDALLLRGVALGPEELAAMNQRLAAHGYVARAQDDGLLLQAQERP
ncbi:type II secretion system protein GspL [Oryzisolibacter sp. LB2S]|uniref:type II secretion system protein GspL n=1 Tax=Alicycliphilus soli TaxID=3228789 RepID=UPI0034588CBD